MNPTPITSESALNPKENDRMKSLAEQGNEDAQRVVALARAADQENAGAQFYLAHSLQEGAFGLTRDPERKRELLPGPPRTAIPKHERSWIVWKNPRQLPSLQEMSVSM